MLSLTTGYRKIKDGRKFDQFFPSSPLHGDPIVMRNGTVEDSVALMARIAKQYKSDTALIAPVLKGDTIYETCRNIWDFIYAYIQYQEDEDGVEQIRRPLRTWSDRSQGVDCDCMSVFASSILQNLKYPHLFRITKYEKPEFQHVYVIVPTNGSINGFDTYITIDGVIDGFNKEKHFSANKDFDAMNGMPIQLLNGLGHAVSDTDGLVYNFLVDQEKLMQQNPALLQGKICPCDAAPMFNYIIGNWNDVHNRATALEHIATIERTNFPEMKFFQKLWDYMEGTATMEDVIASSYIQNSLNGLNGGSYGYGDNGDGTYYIYDDSTGETVSDNLSWNQMNSQLNIFMNPPGGGDNNPSNGNPGQWWNSWGSGVSNLLANVLKTFVPGTGNPGGGTTTVLPTGGGTTITKPPVTITPTATNNSTMLWAVVAALAVGGGALIYFANKSPKKKLPAKS